MIYIPGQIVEAWGLRAIVQEVLPDGMILVRHADDDPFLRAGVLESFPKEMLFVQPIAHQHKHPYPFSLN